MGGVPWHELNARFKRDYEAAIALALGELADRGGDPALVEREVAAVLEQVGALGLQRAGRGRRRQRLTHRGAQAEVREVGAGPLMICAADDSAPSPRSSPSYWCTPMRLPSLSWKKPMVPTISPMNVAGVRISPPASAARRSMPSRVAAGVQIDGAALVTRRHLLAADEVERDRHVLPGRVFPLVRSGQTDAFHALHRDELALQDGAVELHGAVQVRDRDVGPDDQVVHCRSFVRLFAGVTAMRMIPERPALKAFDVVFLHGYPTHCD